MTDEWSLACIEMSRDVNAVVESLFVAGVKQVKVKDFHRTAYNLLPELIDSRAQIVSGYKYGPVPGIGSPGQATAVMFLGMHAASGTGGFMAHTLTSRLKKLEVNGRPLSELELFSASLAPYGVRPLFFSGCPIACAQAREAIENIDCHAIDKSNGPDSFDPHSWRSGLAQTAVGALNNSSTHPYNPEGPFEAAVTMRDGERTARKMALRWGFRQEGDRIFIRVPHIHGLYSALIELCYLTPLTKRILPLALLGYNVKGRLGLTWVRRHQRAALGAMNYAR
jgi:D-amino peptidase